MIEQMHLRRSMRDRKVWENFMRILSDHQILLDTIDNYNPADSNNL